MSSPINYNIEYNHQTVNRDWIIPCGDNKTIHHTDSIVLGGSTYNNLSNLEFEVSHRTSASSLSLPFSSTPTTTTTTTSQPTQSEHTDTVPATPAQITTTSPSNLKSAIRLTRSINLLDNEKLPTHGYYYKYTTEASGLIGDSNALKFTGSYRTHKPLGAYTTFSWTLSAGIQQPFRTLYNLAANHLAPSMTTAAVLQSSEELTSQGEGQIPIIQETDKLLPQTNSGNKKNDQEEYQNIPIFDRFYAHSLSTRGIAPEDMGPKLNRKAFGSDAYCSTTAMMSFIIPNFQDIPIRPHIYFSASQFLTLSSILQAKYGGNHKSHQTINDSMHLTASTGVGISASILGGHAELNFGSQIKNGKVLKPTLSFGVTSNLDW